MPASSAGAAISGGGACGPVSTVQSQQAPPAVLAKQGNPPAVVPGHDISSGAADDQHLQVLLFESLQTVQSCQVWPQSQAGQGPFHAYQIIAALPPQFALYSSTCRF